MIPNNLAIGSQAVQPLALVKPAASQSSSGAEVKDTPSFSAYLDSALNQVAAQEQQAKEMSNKFILGEVNVDEAMIASQQSLLSLQLTTQVRNKVIEAYQEIMRTQI